MLPKNIAVLAALLLATVAVAPAARASSPGGAVAAAGGIQRLVRGPDKLLAPLADRLRKAAPDDSFDVVVQLAPGQETASALAALQGDAGAFATRASWQRALHGFAARLTARQIAALQRSPLVVQIDPDLQVTADLDTSTRFTGARQARADFAVDGSLGEPGYSSDNVVIAVIDTGIDASHPDLQGKVIAWDDEINHQAAPYDDNGHGTHVSSIAAGTGAASGGKYAGNAPGAALVGIKVLSGQGSGSISGIVSGIDWMLNKAADLNIRVANMSLGAQGCSDGTDALSQAVDNAVNQGVLMVIAAGNSGPGSCTVGSPGAARNALTVGASVDPGKNGWALAYFSSRGPTADGRTKPDVVAPGWNITAAKAGSTGYIAHSGTSMATPQVTGIAALLFAAHPTLGPTDVKDLLTSTAEHWGPAGANNEYGAGLVRPYAALAKLNATANTFKDGTKHGFSSGSLGWFGADSYNLSVQSTARPIGLTMIIKQWSWPGWPVIDLYLYAPDGTQVASSTSWSRQQTITYAPKTTGTYKVVVSSYLGAGDYWLDTSSPS